MSNLLHLSRLSVDAGAEQAAVHAWRAAGAVGPGNARPLAALPDVDPAVFERLLARGRLREGEPGRFYLYEGAEGGRGSLATRLWFWLLLIGLPVVLHQIFGGR